MNDEMNDFFQQHVNYGIIVNCTLQNIDHIRRFLAEEGIHVIYQRTSLSKLLITEKEHSEYMQRGPNE